VAALLTGAPSLPVPASDRLTGPLRAIARRADPLAPYRAMYRAKVVAQSGDHLRVDVIPEDTGGLLPPMSQIPLRHGIPGITVQVGGGAYVLVGWENGRPNRPFAGLWANPSGTGESDARGDSGAGGGAVVGVVLNGLFIRLGGKELELLPAVHGVLTGQDVDPFTGMQHWMLGNGSTKVMAKK
jgi:hypothetical protein